MEEIRHSSRRSLKSNNLINKTNLIDTIRSCIYCTFNISVYDEYTIKSMVLRKTLSNSYIFGIVDKIIGYSKLKYISFIFYNPHLTFLKINV